MPTSDKKNGSLLTINLDLDNVIQILGKLEEKEITDDHKIHTLVRDIFVKCSNFFKYDPFFDSKEEILISEKDRGEILPFIYFFNVFITKCCRLRLACFAPQWEIFFFVYSLALEQKSFLKKDSEKIELSEIILKYQLLMLDKDSHDSFFETRNIFQIPRFNQTTDDFIYLFTNLHDIYDLGENRDKQKKVCRSLVSLLMKAIATINNIYKTKDIEVILQVIIKLLEAFTQKQLLRKEELLHYLGDIADLVDGLPESQEVNEDFAHLIARIINEGLFLKKDKGFYNNIYHLIEGFLDPNIAIICNESFLNHKDYDLWLIHEGKLLNSKTAFHLNSPKTFFLDIKEDDNDITSIHSLKFFFEGNEIDEFIKHSSSFIIFFFPLLKKIVNGQISPGHFVNMPTTEFNKHFLQLSSDKTKKQVDDSDREIFRNDRKKLFSKLKKVEILKYDFGLKFWYFNTEYRFIIKSPYLR